jgi:hypothetical protein
VVLAAGGAAGALLLAGADDGALDATELAGLDDKPVAVSLVLVLLQAAVVTAIAVTDTAASRR